ncbi:hypothetical protein FGO68_gene9874 [Halteria grandinella]|uniref:Uncharacterized protein n=1 Tax=Halteria grandinella TaxID=5974 RepID=A0A8J8P0J3_HALGN|nr:hypothetical protein FGO68_gene9874 [Halteria grandinella]
MLSSKLSHLINAPKGASEEGFDLSFDIKKNQVLFLNDEDDDDDELDEGTTEETPTLMGGSPGKAKNDEYDLEYQKMIGQGVQKVIKQHGIKRSMKDKQAHFRDNLYKQVHICEKQSTNNHQRTYQGEVSRKRRNSPPKNSLQKDRTREQLGIKTIQIAKCHTCG